MNRVAPVGESRSNNTNAFTFTRSCLAEPGHILRASQSSFYLLSTFPPHSHPHTLLHFRNSQQHYFFNQERIYNEDHLQFTMRLNPLNLLKSLFNSADAKPTASNPTTDASSNANPFLNLPVQLGSRALPVPANVYSYVPQAAKLEPNTSSGKIPARSAVNSLSGLSLPSDANPFAKASSGPTHRPLPANAYSYKPPNTPFSNAAFPAYVHGIKNNMYYEPIPKFTVSSFVSVSPSVTSSTSPTGTVDIDMTDGESTRESTPPATTLPGKRENHTAPSLPHPTVVTGEGDQGLPASSTSTDARPKLRPKCQRERHVVNHAKRDYAAEITYEEDDGDLPEGYLGTWNRMRFYSPEIDMPCRYGDASSLLHHLSCGHWVTTDEKLPCGLNCHNPDFDVAPFSCPTCHQAVEDVIKNQLSEKEKARVDQAKSSGHEIYLVGFLVEFVSKRIKMKANITETVISFVRESKHGRNCQVADLPKTASSPSLERQVKQYYERKAEKELAAQNPPTATKRKSYTQLVQPFTKKPKYKPTTDDEPPSPQARGIKRQSTSNHLAPQKKVRTVPPVQNDELPSPPTRGIKRGFSAGYPPIDNLPIGDLPIQKKMRTVPPV